MYRCEVDMFYRQHDKNYEIAKVRKEFTGVDQADVYGYMQYYCLKFGMCDIKMIDEHEIGQESQPIPDHSDTGANTFTDNFQASINKTQDAIQRDINISQEKL